MIFALMIVWITCLVPTIICFVLKKHDWYWVFIFPMILLSVVCMLLSIISDKISIAFSLIVCCYVIYSFTSKRARNIYRESRQDKKERYLEYKKNEADGQSGFKDYLLPSGRKVDYINFNTKTIYLLRPYTENIEKRYEKEIKKYIFELEKTYGGKWNYVIDTY